MVLPDFGSYRNVSKYGVLDIRVRVRVPSQWVPWVYYISRPGKVEGEVEGEGGKGGRLPSQSGIVLYVG